MKKPSMERFLEYCLKYNYKSLGNEIFFKYSSKKPQNNILKPLNQEMFRNKLND